MTIDEAIETLRITPSYNRYPGDRQGVEALELGIEALKYRQFLKSHRLITLSDLLPGETQEVKGEQVD